jgi:histidyl-tRNA synthetase
MGQNAVPVANKLASELRNLGLRAETDLMNRSVKAQMKYADKTNSRFAVVIGDSEVESGTVTVKDMAGGEPFETSLADAAKEMAARI